MLVVCRGCLSLAQVRRELVGDTEPVTAVAVSPDDETVVVASRSRLLRLYDWTTGVVKRSFKVVSRPPPTHSTHTP
jgi:WD40 repeat protein